MLNFAILFAQTNSIPQGVTNQDVSAAIKQNPQLSGLSQEDFQTIAQDPTLTAMIYSDMQNSTISNTTVAAIKEKLNKDDTANPDAEADKSEKNGSLSMVSTGATIVALSILVAF
eukprot:NODE_281_length_11904_cov_0.253452.p10 type:complete len:115 gc:universal NODE_281_length_11904_cov_0.253452:11567-11223(-)